jgi:hypothetical protein
MKVSGKWIWVGMLTVFSPMAFAAMAAAERYQQIPERNVFGLKEIPQSIVSTNTEPPAAVPKIFLTGISTLGGFKRAFLSVQAPAKAGQPAKEEYLILTEGQREEGLEVLSIDENAKAVRVNNSGTVMSLDFEKNGVKTVANTAAAPGANQPNQPGVVTPGMAPAVPQANPSTAAITPPSVGYRRTLRLPNATPQPVTTVSPPQSTATLGGPAATAQRQAAGTSTAITPEEELLLQALQEKNNGQIAPQ